MLRNTTAAAAIVIIAWYFVPNKAANVRVQEEQSKRVKKQDKKCKL